MYYIAVNADWKEENAIAHPKKTHTINTHRTVIGILWVWNFIRLQKKSNNQLNNVVSRISSQPAVIQIFTIHHSWGGRKSTEICKYQEYGSYYTVTVTMRLLRVRIVSEFHRKIGDIRSWRLVSVRCRDVISRYLNLSFYSFLLLSHIFHSNLGILVATLPTFSSFLQIRIPL